MNPMLDAERIATALHSQGWWVHDAALDLSLCGALSTDLRVLDAAAELTTAGVGRAARHRHDINIRGDRIAWLTPATTAQRTFLAGLESLRITLNGSLYLGLAEAEAHFAQYDAGARYQLHVDSFQGASNRVVSLVAYLNNDWSAADGGELILYAPDATRELVRIAPCAGTVVVFLSEELPHQVLVARRGRASIAAWLRRAPV
jgi:SM-20-related protein